jgi:hypothetical protein
VYLSNGTPPPLGMVKREKRKGKKGENRKKRKKDEIKRDIERWNKCTRAKNKGEERVCEVSIFAYCGREKNIIFFFWGGRGEA